MQGTAHERAMVLAQVSPISVAAAATAVSANSVDCTGFEELLGVLNVGAFTGGVTSVTIEFEDSADGTTFAAVSGASSTTTVGGTANRPHVCRARRSRLRQFVRIKLTVNGGTSAIVGATLIGLSAKTEPVTQLFTVGFSLT